MKYLFINNHKINKEYDNRYYDNKFIYYLLFAL